MTGAAAHAATIAVPIRIHARFGMRATDRPMLTISNSIRRYRARPARVIFTVEGDAIYLRHGFIKTTQKIPPDDLRLVEKRWKKIKP
ncbi:MAG: type II toxin-antitoxin system RelE/ParE family toxin [Betaproteobacteria bacterium]|nr:type II toxin-antitoxin system RelE/ParE family toxin [Betaproteobacteria bacterium]